MSSQYQSNQFFKIGRSRPSQWKREGHGNDNTAFVSPNALNDDFLFPDKTIRNIKPSPDGKTWTEDNRILQKGYIRRINEFNEGNEGPLLCRFQFNPERLNQAASFQSGVVNPIYQPIEQLQQPISSMTNFNFRLLFDRTMEVNQPSFQTVSSDNPWETGGPSQVGVLHDINALFRVIGQGISADDVEGAITRAAEALSASDAVLGKDSVTEEDDAIYGEARLNSSRFFQNNVNVGNTAFILPYPVRIVFSSLYIVEGFVTQTSLEILKFSSSYVPMVAQVTLSVNAIYLGFAKRNTYFTHVLEQSAIERRNELARITDTVAQDAIQVKQLFNNLTVKLGRRDVRNNSTREFIGTGIGTPVIKFNQLFDDVTEPEGFKYSKPRVWSNPTDWVAPARPVDNPARLDPNRRAGDGSEDPPSKIEVDPISKLFGEGSLTSINFKWKATLFGPFTANNDLRRVTRNASSADDIRNIPTLASARKFESNEQGQTVTTMAQWKKLHEPELKRRSSPFDPSPDPSSPEPSGIPFSLELPVQFSSTLGDTNNWVLLFEGSYEVTLNRNTYLDSAFSVLVLNRDATAPLATTLNFSWSRYDALANPAPGGPPSPPPGSVRPTSGTSVDGGVIPI
jgi:hypothetical protein